MNDQKDQISLFRFIVEHFLTTRRNFRLFFQHRFISLLTSINRVQVALQRNIQGRVCIALDLISILQAEFALHWTQHAEFTLHWTQQAEFRLHWTQQAEFTFHWTSTGRVYIALDLNRHSFTLHWTSSSSLVRASRLFQLLF